MDSAGFDPTRHPSYVADRSVSLAALHLHTAALLSGAQSGRAGFVSDTELAALSHTQIWGDTTFAVLELCLAGVWHRIEGRQGDAPLAGYRIGMNHGPRPF